MVSELSWQVEENVLFLTGQLTDKTLFSLWQWMKDYKPTFHEIDVNQLTHIDSAGLALIIYTLNQAGKQGVKVKLSGSNDKLKTLITLYNLDDVITS